MNVLFTGFEPFGGDSVNPSERICAELEQATNDAIRIQTALLPVSFVEAPKKLEQALQTYRPSVVISMGYSAKATCVLLERVALNVADARIPDNDKYQPSDTSIIQAAPFALETTFPVREAIDYLYRQGIPVKQSYSAGTYVCNALFYHLLFAQRQTGYLRSAGFVHLPALPEMVIGKPEQAFLPLDYMTNIIRKLALWLAERIRSDDIKKEKSL
jgi:pyroglutamyl-peptidase